jgi:nucleotide-binding universal stress UspA family protein
MRVVVPLDLSEVAAEAVAHAVDIARGVGDDLLFVTVLSSRLKADLAELAESQNTNVPDMVDAYLKSAAAAAHDVPAEHTVITGEDAADALIRFADDESIRMVVMATHGRSGVARWRLGSITERVVRHSDVPVLVVPARNLLKKRAG